MRNYLISDASSVFNLLNGICCVYKTAGETIGNVRRSLLYKLATELCQLECKEPTPYVQIEGDTTKPMNIKVMPSFVDNSLVIGPKYHPKDFKCVYTTPLGINTSGVLVFGLNGGTKDGQFLREMNPIRTYKISGRLGEAKDNLYTTGKTIDKGGYKHIKESYLQQFLATLQSSHQRLMFDLCGVDMTSQTAYELACGGLIRPTNRKVPLIYSIECVSFNLPDFTLEVQCVNEYEAYLMALIHDTGVKLHTVAHCTKLQCIRHSFFTLDHALLKKHWTLQEVIANLAKCSQILHNNSDVSQHLVETSITSSVT